VPTAADTFATAITTAYAVDGPALDLGLGVLNGQLDKDAIVRMPLAMLNRHGLVAGATGTGKTRTLQLLAEQLSEQGVSVFAADYKGDLSGLEDPGAADGPAPKRMADLGLPYQPTSYPAEFLSLGGIGDGARPARRAHPACTAGIHARRRRRAEEDRPHVSDVGLLRPRQAAHRGRYRRGRRHDPLRQGHPDSGRPHGFARRARA
jgi:hypothetical protein